MMDSNMSAADSLDEGPMEEESDSENGGEDSFFIPADTLQGKNCKAGDVLKFEVLGMDKDGDVEVKLAGMDQSKNREGFGAGLRKAMSAPQDKNGY